MFHYVAGRFGLSRLEISWLQTRKGEHFRGILELAKVAIFREDHSGGQCADPWNREDGRVDAMDAVLDLLFQFINHGVHLRIQIQKDRHLMEKEVAGAANGVLGQGFQLYKTAQCKSAPREPA